MLNDSLGTPYTNAIGNVEALAAFRRLTVLGVAALIESSRPSLGTYTIDRA